MAVKKTKKPVKKHKPPSKRVGGFVKNKPKGFWVPRTPTPVTGLGHIHLWTDDPPLDVYGLLSDERPNVESGYGGWQEIERPHMRPITSWRALPALRMTLPILFNSWTSNESREDDIKALEKMAGRFPGRIETVDGVPPLVHIDSPGEAVPYQSLTWVITDLTWGDALMNENGDRTRQQVTVALMEYSADRLITERSYAKRQRTKAGAGKTKPGAKKKRQASHHKPKKKKWTGSGHGRAVATVEEDDFGGGEDLLSLAARELGDANRWFEIAELNGIRDPRSITPGQVLRMP